MQTIVQVVQHLRPGGLETMALDILRFSQNRERMIIVSLEGDKKTALQSWPRLSAFEDQLVFLNKPDGFSLSTLRSLSDLLRQVNADVIHTHHIGPLIYGGLAAKLTGLVSHVHTEHDARHLDDNKRAKLQKLAIWMSNPVVVAAGGRIAATLETKLQLPFILTIRNGIDSQKFTPGCAKNARQVMGLPQDATILGCAGRLEPVKCQQLMIEALPHLPPSVHLAIAGTGSLSERLKSRAHILGVENRVHFLGLVEDMPTFYQSLDLFCLPSHNEGFPLSTLEAQSCGIPTAVSMIGGSMETLCPETGRLLDVSNPEGLASSINKILATPISGTPRNHIVKSNDVRLMAWAYDDLCKKVA